MTFTPSTLTVRRLYIHGSIAADPDLDRDEAAAEFDQWLGTVFAGDAN